MPEFKVYRSLGLHPVGFYGVPKLLSGLQYVVYPSPFYVLMKRRSANRIRTRDQAIRVGN